MKIHHKKFESLLKGKLDNCVIKGEAIHGSPVFEPKDVELSENFLDRILRMYFIENNISKEYFNERAKIYGLNALGLLANQLSNYRSNLLKAVKIGNITINKFNEVMCNVLNVRYEDVVIHINDGDDIKTYSYKGGAKDGGTTSTRTDQ